MLLLNKTLDTGPNGVPPLPQDPIAHSPSEAQKKSILLSPKTLEQLEHIAFKKDFSHFQKPKIRFHPPQQWFEKLHQSFLNIEKDSLNSTHSY